MSKKNILVITFWSYKSGLTQAHVLPYVNIFSKYPSIGDVYLLTQEQKKLSTAEKEEIKKELKNQGINWIPVRYTPFSGKSLMRWGFILLPKLWWLIIKKRIKMLHAWCTPDGAVAFVLSKLTGTPMLVDFYEPHADSMVELGEWSKNSTAYHLLKSLEIAQTLHAKYLICSNKNMPKYVKQAYKYEIPPQKLFYKPNCINFTKFYPRKKNETLLKELGLENKIIGLYVGKFGGIYWEEETFQLFKEALDYYGKDNFTALILTPTPVEEVEKLAEKANFPKENFIAKFVFHNEIPEYMSLADFAVSPIKPVYTKRFSSPIKDGEYWAMGLPVIIPENISDDSDIIKQHNIGYVLKDLSQQEFQNAIKYVDNLIKTDGRENLQKRIFKVAKKYRDFSIAEKVYKKIYG